MTRSTPAGPYSLGERWLLASVLGVAVVSLGACGQSPELPQARLAAGGRVTALAMSPDGHLLASGVGGRHATAVEIRLWDVTTREQLGALKSSSTSMGALAFGPDGNTIYCGRLDGTIERWSLGTRRLEYAMRDVAPVESLAIRPDGTTLLSTGGKGFGVRVFDLRARTQVDALGGKAVTAMALSSDGKGLAIGQWPLRIELVDLDTRRPIRSFAPQGEPRRLVKQVALSGEGKLMVTATDGGRLEWWDLSTGRSLGAMDAHVSFARDAEPVLSMAFSPDGASLATSGADGTIRLWNTHTRERTRMLAEKSLFELWSNADLRPEPCCLVFTDGGNALFSGHYDRLVRVWATRRSGPAERSTQH